MTRQILCGLACLILLCSALPAAAEQSPTDTLKSTVDQVLLTLKQPEYRDPATRPPLRAKVEAEILKVFDIMEFSRRTLSSYWKKFTPEQQKRFADAFAELLMTTYLDKVDGYNGEQVVYLGERYIQKGKLAEVQSTITLSTGQVTPVAYRMRLTDSGWRIYDVLIENVGLNSNYRTQFQEILAKSTPEDLIRQVEQRVQELRQQNKNS